jgi:uncharacterized protein (TIGR01244 family)
MSLGIPYEFRPTDKLICAGSLTAEALSQAAREDVVQVINLCPPAEMTWDEQAAAEQMGMTYHNIPVAGPSDLSDDNVQRLLELLDEAPGVTLLHCASSNRVGALMALAAQSKGANMEEALAIGRQSGLTKLEPVAAALLEQRAQA